MSFSDADWCLVFPRAAHGPVNVFFFFFCSISIYKSSQGCKKVRLQHFYTPDKSTVMSLACSPQGLYAGLVNGSVASYTKAPGNDPHSALTLV